MHRNPVQRGLVASPELWRWSSYRAYALGEPGRVKVNEWQVLKDEDSGSDGLRAKTATADGVAGHFSKSARSGAPPVLQGQGSKAARRYTSSLMGPTRHGRALRESRDHAVAHSLVMNRPPVLQQRTPSGSFASDFLPRELAARCFHQPTWQSR